MTGFKVFFEFPEDGLSHFVVDDWSGPVPVKGESIGFSDRGGFYLVRKVVWRVNQRGVRDLHVLLKKEREK